MVKPIKQVFEEIKYAKSKGPSKSKFYRNLQERGILEDRVEDNGRENESRLRDVFTKDFYNEVTEKDLDYKDPSKLGGLTKYKEIIDNPFLSFAAAPALKHIGMILNYRKQGLGERSDVAYAGKLTANVVKAPNARFKLMAEAVAMAALEKAAGGAGNVVEDHVKVLADMIAKAGNGPRDLFKDFRFALKSDIGKDEDPVKMLHDLPEIVAIATALCKNEMVHSLEIDESKYIFGRKEIAREGVELIVGRAVGRSFNAVQTVASEYIRNAAKELGTDLAHDIDGSRAQKIKDDLVEQMMGHVSIKAGGEKGKMTVRELAERVASPVGKGLLEAAISDQLLQRTKTLEKVKKGWFDWKKEETPDQKEFKSEAMARAALTEFMKFNPDDVTTFTAADELKARINEEVSGRAKRYEEALKSVDVMVIQEMQNRVKSDKFALDPLVVRSLTQHLYDDNEIDQVAFCSAFCDKLEERGGNFNKTIKLSHFEKKGDRTQGTWANYFRKARDNFWKALGWPKSSTNADALIDVLKEVGDSVKSGIPPLRVYSSHRDAKYAVEKAIEGYFEKNHRLVVDDAVLNALTKQVTVLLEKARVDGKKMYLADIIDTLQPGMVDLGQRRRDSRGVITEKTIGDFLPTNSPRGGFAIGKKGPSKTLANICKEIVTENVPGDDGLEIMGMTRKELVAYVLSDKEVHKAYLGNKAQEKSLVKAINSALEVYGEHPYTSEFIDKLMIKAVSSLTITKTTDKKGVVEITASFDSSLIENLVKEEKKAADQAFEAEREATKAERVRRAVVEIDHGDNIPVGVISFAGRVQGEEVLPMLNSAKALFDFVLKNNATNSDYCIQVINDPKYAKVLHDSLFSVGDQDPKQLGEYLEANKLAIEGVIKAIKDRQNELSACAEEFSDMDIKTLAEKLDIVKSAGFKINGSAEDKEEAFVAIDRLIQGVSVPVYGVEKDWPVLLTGDPGPRDKCADLLRFIQSSEVDKDKVAQFIVDRGISQADKANCEVNGKPLVEYILEKGLDIRIMQNAAEKQDIQANRAVEKALAEAQARAAAEAAKAAAEAAKAAAKKAALDRVIGEGVSRGIQEEAERARVAAAEQARAAAEAERVKRSGVLGALGRAIGWGGTTVTKASPPSTTPKPNPGRGTGSEGPGVS